MEQERMKETEAVIKVVGHFQKREQEEEALKKEAWIQFFYP